MLEAENDGREEYETAPARVYEAAGGYAPTVGILGAVLGLIHVMENLSDPGKLGAGIAVAFVATVYGVGSANLILLPIAAKLRSRALRRSRRREVVLEGVLAIQEGQNPRVIDQKLRGLLAAEEAAPAAGARRRAA
jgi:chemotaxis protein MotA